MSARTLAAAPQTWMRRPRAGFSRWTDRYRDAHGEVARREFGAVRVVRDGGFKPRSRDDDGGRLAPRLLGGFRPRGALFLCCSRRGLAGPWPRGLAALCFGECAARGGAARWGGCPAWGICGVAAAVLGRLRWCVWGRDAPLRRANQMATINGPPPPVALEWHSGGRCKPREGRVAPADPLNPGKNHAGESLLPKDPRAT